MRGEPATRPCRRGTRRGGSNGRCSDGRPPADPDARGARRVARRGTDRRPGLRELLMILEPETPIGGWAEHSSGLIVPDYVIEPPRPIGIDLFAGCGGMSCGMHQGGWHVIAALEFSFDAAVTYMVNLARPGVQIHFDSAERREGFERHLEKRMGLTAAERSHGRKKRGKKKRKHRKVQRVIEPLVAGSGWISCFDQCDCPPGAHEGIGYDGKYNDYLAEINQRPAHGLGCEHFWIADARTITGKEILDTLGMQRGEVDCVFGGPPCQGFSFCGRRNVLDPRNSLVFEFLRLVIEIHPKAVVFENVPGMMSMTTPEGIPVVDAMCR